MGDGIKRHLSRGDLVVMPYAEAYASRSEEEAEPISITSLPPPPWTTFPQIDYGGDGENTRMVCGYLRGDAVLFDPVLRALPPLFVVKPAGPAAAWVTATTSGITEIATRVGYTSEEAFSRAFKRWLGKSPAYWRESNE